MNTKYFNYTHGSIIVKDPINGSLAGSPKHIIDGNFNCTDNKITSLVGGPEIVDGYFSCDDNLLTDLNGAPRIIGAWIDFRHNPKITSLVGIHKIIKKCPDFTFNSSCITHGGIGLLLIENLARISAGAEPFKIIKRYIGTGTKGMMECSKELKAKGYDEYAKL